MKKKAAFLSIIFIILLIAYKLFNNVDVFNNKNQRVIDCSNCLVKSEKTAVQLAEILLFQAYGEDKIKEERPYDIELVDNKTWIITGTLNDGKLSRLLYGGVPKFGGTFEIKINAKDAQIIYMTHYK